MISTSSFLTEGGDVPSDSCCCCKDCDGVARNKIDDTELYGRTDFYVTLMLEHKFPFRLIKILLMIRSYWSNPVTPLLFPTTHMLLYVLERTVTLNNKSLNILVIWYSFTSQLYSVESYKSINLYLYIALEHGDRVYNWNGFLAFDHFTLLIPSSFFHYYLRCTTLPHSFPEAVVILFILSGCSLIICYDI